MEILLWNCKKKTRSAMKEKEGGSYEKSSGDQ